MSEQVTTNAICRCGNYFGVKAYTGEGLRRFSCPSCGRLLTVSITRDSRGKIVYEIGNPS